MTQVNYVERKHTDCEKWDALPEIFGENDLLPMWVADMDFQAPSCVLDALHQYISHGVFGYYRVPDSYYDSFIKWEEKHHGYRVEKDWIRFSPGVVSAFHWIIQFMTKPSDKVLVLTPVYYPFFHAIENNGRKLITSDLHNEGGVYTVDFEDFEKKIAGVRDISRIMEENRIRYEDNFSELWKESGKIHKICNIGPKQDIDRIAEYFEKKSEIAQKIEWNGLWYIELLPAGCGKGEAVDFLNDRLGIAREESMGFGDGENDVGMLRSVGIGVAVEGAGEGLLKYADSICEKPVDDGIYRELVRRNVIREEIGQNRIKEKIGQSRIEEETPVERRA